MADKIYIATTEKAHPGQLLSVLHDEQQVMVQIVQEISKEEHKRHTPDASEKDYAELPEGVQFYETDVFTGEVVLAMREEKKPGDIARNQELGTWKILRSATPEEYLESLIKHGEAGPGSPVLEPIMTLVRVGQEDLKLYWATPYTPPTAILRLTREELLFIGHLLMKWSNNKDAERLPVNTFVIAKLKEALGSLAGREVIQKVEDSVMKALEESPSVDRVH